MPQLLRIAVTLLGLAVSTASVQAQNNRLSRADLEKIYLQAANRAAELTPRAVIAVVDRDGRLLLLKRADNKGTITSAQRAIAVSKAGTAVYLSSNKHAFSSRTAGFIIQQNFPPRVLNRPPGPLVGVGFSNLAFSDVNFFSQRNGNRIPGTRLYASPGGVPLYKRGVLVAGIGVTGDGTEQEDATITRADRDESIALAGQRGYAPRSSIHGSRVFIDGIRLPYVASRAVAAKRRTAVLGTRPLVPPPPKPWPIVRLGGVRGELRAPIIGDPRGGKINGQNRLTAAEVRSIIARAAARSARTRAGIRLPAGQPAAVFITVVNNPNRDGVAPRVLGTFRTPDATIFSWDVSVQKARSAVFFSNNRRAYSTRTVGFLAQSMFPPGIHRTRPGPFNGLQERHSIPLLRGTAGANRNLPNGITIFPGGIPLYRNNVLVGAIGVSGDGIDQDDLIAAAGTLGFQPRKTIRADNHLYKGVRLPYVKFPRNPELTSAGGHGAPGQAFLESLQFTLAQHDLPKVLLAAGS